MSKNTGLLLLHLKVCSLGIFLGWNLIYNNNNNNNLLSLLFHVHKSVLIRTYLRVTKLALLSALFVFNIVDGFYVREKE